MGIRTEEKVINYIRRKIRNSRKVVAVLGLETLFEGGGIDLDSNNEHYRLEEEYGFGMEDMLSASFFNSKVEKFYRFYKKEILGMDIHSTRAHDALANLQNQGKLLAVINQNFHGVPPNIPLKRVIELNGNLGINRCPRCGIGFGIGHVTKADLIPMCEKCNTALRPQIRLIGERVDTKKMTEAATVCAEAEVLLVLGRNLYYDRLEYGAAPEHEQLKVLFSKNEMMENKNVDFIIRDDICEFLPLVVD